MSEAWKQFKKLSAHYHPHSSVYFRNAPEAYFIDLRSMVNDMPISPMMALNINFMADIRAMKAK